MHELSIAMEVVDLACDHISHMGTVRVDAVHMRVGLLSGVVKDALLFSFEAAALGTAVEGARLEIEDVPVTVWCATCVAERPLAQLARRRCPVCTAVTPEVRRGEELEVVRLEIADA
jgi:hydrogenase nickel incorporation protein HypA/HybF